MSAFETVPRKLRRAFRIARLVRNFPEVYLHLTIGSSLDQICLRNGIRISCCEGVPLWRLFHDIWISEVYTRDCDPIRKGSVVLDIGASVGVFSLLAGSRGGDVYSFEPDPVSFECLQSNASCNVGVQISAFRYAVAGSSTRRQLHRRDSRTGTSLSRSKQTHPPGSAGEIWADCITLSEILEKNSIERCQFAKLNCEGAEFEILFSTPRQKLKRIETFMVECHNELTRHSCTDLIAHLESCGYSVSITLARQDGTSMLVATSHE